MQSRERVGDNSEKNSRSSNYSGPDETGRAEEQWQPWLSLNAGSQFNPAQQSELDSQNPTQQSKWIPAVTAESGSPPVGLAEL